MMSAKRRWGLAIAASWMITLAATLPDTGLTDDVEAYVGASAQYATWWSRAVGGERSAWTRREIDGAWQYNAEHPPLAKLVMGASWWLFHQKLGWMGQVTAARVGTVVIATFGAWLLFSLCWDRIGRRAAIAAPLSLLFMPRYFFDAHAETLDAAAATTSLLTVVAFLRALERNRKRDALACGAAFGLALASKHNALALPLALVLWVSIRALLRRGADGPLVPPAAWRSALAMAVVGPLVLFALWPWMWFDTFARFGAYLRFHLHHYGILFFYLGHIYEWPPAPWHAPLLMTLITTPLVTLALAAIGIRAAVRSVRARDGQADLALLLLCAAATAIGIVSLPGVPKYAGVKLFLPFFPLLAALAGWGVEKVVAWALAKRRESGERVAAVVVTLAVAPAAVGLWAIHPYELSYYGLQAGGLRGAARLGMETQYYDLIHVELVDWMNRNLPLGSRVTFLPNNKEYVRNAPWWQRDGLIRPDLQFVGLEQADVLVLTHERRWPDYPAIAADYRGRPVLWELRKEGVALLTVYPLQ